MTPGPPKSGLVYGIMIYGYPRSGQWYGFWVERSKVKVRIKVRINSNTAWVRTL